jgi:hypothetical protein
LKENTCHPHVLLLLLLLLLLRRVGEKHVFSNLFATGIVIAIATSTGLVIVIVVDYGMS